MASANATPDDVNEQFENSSDECTSNAQEICEGFNDDFSVSGSDFNDSDIESNSKYIIFHCSNLLLH